MISPPSLKSGDKIGLVSTARKITKEELEFSISTLTQWGLEVCLAPNLLKAQNQFAGSDSQRITDMQTFIDDQSIKAILCVRGGYGTIRIIDELDFSSLTHNPKWIAGYSDVTVLHNKLTNLGIESLHCSMPINFKTNTTEALESIKDTLFGNAIEYTVKSSAENKTGIATAEIVGGNLSMLYSQLGSNTAIKTEGRILFIEDLDEYLYHIDRMLFNLKRNGYFENLAGIIVGGMSDMNDNTIPFGETAKEIIQRHCKDLKIPICYDFPAGHLNDNRALIFGRQAKLEITKTSSTLSFNNG